MQGFFILYQGSRPKENQFKEQGHNRFRHGGGSGKRVLKPASFLLLHHIFLGLLLHIPNNWVRTCISGQGQVK
jgi:hypothetical protein